MSAPALGWPRCYLPGPSAADARLLGLALAHAALLASLPPAPLVALALWWDANTVSHNFIHRPFFASQALNRVFSACLSLLLGFPQAVWRDGHLAHHAGLSWRLRPTGQAAFEGALVLGLWVTLAALALSYLLTAYLPGVAFGLAICALHGHYEHARGAVSHYGRLYNWLFVNDGYHVEHHADPAAHWCELPRRQRPGSPASRWPPVLRWLELGPLELLERWALSWGRLRRFVLERHERAFRALLGRVGPVRRVAIVGGGLFPRTAILLRRLLPEAQLTVIDGTAANLERARGLVPEATRLVHDWYDPSRHRGFDLVVIPLAFAGDRAALYRRPPAPALLIHDWLWRRRAPGAIVSLLLLKRLNLVSG